MMKELEKIVDSNGEPLEIVDAEAREDISEIKQSLSDLVTLSLNQASGKISSIGGKAYRQGKVIFVSIDLTMNATENSNWIELGTISPAPPKNIRQNTLSDSNMSGATVIRTQIDATTGKIKIFFGGANSYSINMIYMTS